MHIVIAEDDLALLRALTRHFEAAGHKVTATDNAFELASILDDEHERIDCALLDLRLGDASALDVVERNPVVANGSVPVVLFSGQLQPRDVDRANKLGVVRILQKPVEPTVLDQALRQACNAAGSVRGTVHGLSLLDLLQAFHKARRTIGLDVSGSPPGSLIMVDGELTDARCDDLVGEDALDDLLRRQSAIVNTFVIVSKVPHTIPALPFDVLMLDALRRIDKGNRPKTLRPASLAAMQVALDDGPSEALVRASVPSIPAPRVPSFEPPEAPDGTTLSPITPIDAAAAVATKVLPDLQVANVDGDRMWLPESAPNRALLNRLADQIITSVDRSGRWPIEQWMTVMTNTEAGLTGIGIFGSPRLIAGSVLSGKLDRMRFYVALLRAAEAHKPVPQSDRVSSQTLSWPNVGEDEDAQVEAICEELVRRRDEISACRILPRSFVGPTTFGRGKYAVPEDDLTFLDDRWALVERLLDAMDDGRDELEIMVGSLGSRNTLSGTLANRNHYLICSCPSNQLLGSVRSAIQASRSWLVGTLVEPTLSSR